MSVKNKLKDIRHDYRMDQNDFAAFLEVNRTLYNRWENNKKQPSLEWAVKIALKTGRHVEEFINIDPES